MTKESADQAGHIFTDFHHVEISVAALDFQPHRFIDRALRRTIAGLRNDAVQLLQTEGAYDAGLEVEAGRSSVHQCLDFHFARFGLGQLAVLHDQIK
jgi:hypothetical protein